MFQGEGQSTMRACVVHGAKDLRVEERPSREPGPGEAAVAVAVGGICGSDLHYYGQGAVGEFRLVEPMVLGHEIAGRVAALGPGVMGPPVGSAVAVHPATPCGQCPECQEGRRNVCPNARYLGSAARLPHVQGGISERVVVPAVQLRLLPPTLDLHQAVLAEPLAVALHAVHRAGDVAGLKVLVTGAGPIGCLVVAALRHAEACEVVVSDLLAQPLETARRLGATHLVRADEEEPSKWPDRFDVAVEASGSPAGLRTCLERVRPGGMVVQVGLTPPGDIGVPVVRLVTREVTLRGSFRFDQEFDEALDLLAGGLDVSAVVTGSFPLGEAVRAFELAGDRARACKVLIDVPGS
jgi:L-idonate 5-dehydrogenase